MPKPMDLLSADQFAVRGEIAVPRVVDLVWRVHAGAVRARSEPIPGHGSIGLAPAAPLGVRPIFRRPGIAA